LIAGEDFGKSHPSNFAKINSMNCVRSVPTVVRGWCIFLELTSATLIQQTPRKRRRKGVSSVICAVLAV
jgi:hypothetical protein